jgi:hypothetical protein
MVSRPMSRPIFIVGMPRSGSTAFYTTLARHPDVAWISQTSKKLPRSVWLTRLLMLVRWDRRPTEGHLIWKKFVSPEALDDVLRREDVTPEQRQYYRRLVKAHLRLQRRSRFLSKYTRNVLRLEYLDEIFPDALFLHLIRDPRAVARSVLWMRETHGGRDEYWGVRPPGWQRLRELDPVSAIARQWRMTIEYARSSAEALDPERYLEVRYEDFCESPAETLRRVGEWADLVWSEGLLEHVTVDIESQNHKWRDELTLAEIATFDEVAGDLLRELGYSAPGFAGTLGRDATAHR